MEFSATIEALWRYPVSSLRGERVESLALTSDGIRGDRDYLLVDLISGEIAAPEKIARWRPALELEARVTSEGVLISSKDWAVTINDAELDSALSDHFGFRCAIRRAGSSLHTNMGEITLSPRYLASPVHLLSTKSLSELSGLLPEVIIDVRRFRPNIVVDTLADENDWIGRQVAIGAYRGAVTGKTKRCGMTMLGQANLSEDPEILRTIVRKRQRCFGVYAVINSEGFISVGDTVSVE